MKGVLARKEEKAGRLVHYASKVHGASTGTLSVMETEREKLSDTDKHDSGGRKETR